MNEFDLCQLLRLAIDPPRRVRDLDENDIKLLNINEGWLIDYHFGDISDDIRERAIIRLAAALAEEEKKG